MKQITSIDTALRLYYMYPELTNDQIKELFGKGVSDSFITSCKKKVRKEEVKRNIKTSIPYAINTAIAYEVWGLDIKDLEARREKLKKLGFIS